MTKLDTEKILKAGKIASEVKVYAKTIVKKNVLLIDIAEKIEEKIIELGGKPAFPVNLSIDHVAAHYTPTPGDTRVASGLLKVDFGVHIDGWTADNAFTVDLDNSAENKKLITASQEALENAEKIVKAKIRIADIGSQTEKIIESHGFSPIVNLSGHSMDKYDLHAGVNIPNVGSNSNEILEEGLYAIEPFASNGTGRVHDGGPSGIYALIDSKTPRSQIAREVLNFIAEEYETLPFCSRWVVKALGSKSLLGLRELEANGNLHHFQQLVDSKGSKVSQAENTFLVQKEKTIVTTI